MLKQFIFYLLLIITSTCYGQKKKNHLPSPTQIERIEEINNSCIKKFNKSFTNRLKNYPFNISTQVQFVSFISTMTEDGEKINFNDSLPRLNDTICYSKLHEIKTLTFSQVDKLTDIFYNYSYKGNSNTIKSLSCYNPRNAILFLDNKGKVIEFIEVCFECRKTEESSDKISLGDMCEQKIYMLKNLFKKVGIEYGVIKDN